MMLKSPLLVVALNAVLCCSVGQASAQTAPSGRGTRPAQTPTRRPATPPPAPAAAPPAAPAPVAAQPVVAAPAAPEKPKDGKVSIAIIGEDRMMDNPNKWQRSLMAAAFEDELVGSKRFRVVSQSVVEDALRAQKAAVDGSVDPSMAIQIGKRVQAKYVVVVRQIRSVVRRKGLPLPKTILDMELQAQVINIETTDIAQSTSYPKETTLTFEIAQADKQGRPLPMDQSQLGPKYSETVKAIAKDFITSAAVTLMPLQTVVVGVSPTEAILFAGAEVGLAPGAEFEVMKVTGVIDLPDGRKVESTVKVGRLRVSRVENLISYAQFAETYSDDGVKDATPMSTRIGKDMLVRYIPAAGAPARGKK